VGELKEKIDAYLAAGAQEGWIMLEDLSVRLFTGAGETVASRFTFDLGRWRSEFGR